MVEVDESINQISIKSERIFGTSNRDSTLALTKQVVGLLPPSAPGKLDSQNVKWALATIYGIGPKDELEGLLAVQMVGVHSLAMECLSRASRCQTMEGLDADINQATKLLRTFTAQMETLNRHRGKVGQQMVVGSVNVNDGGQAIVGPVRQGGPGKASSEDDADKSK
jgi:hypothetical protein